MDLVDEIHNEMEHDNPLCPSMDQSTHGDEIQLNRQPDPTPHPLQPHIVGQTDHDNEDPSTAPPGSFDSNPHDAPTVGEVDEGVECCSPGVTMGVNGGSPTNSPLSNDELSLDSGVVSLDDQEPISDKCEESREGTRKRSNGSLLCGQGAKRVRSSTKRSVDFEKVKIYFFPRRQSFVTVPSQGGSTLGMGMKHTAFKEMTLDQHKISMARCRRLTARDLERQQRIEAKLKQLRQNYPSHETSELMTMIVDAEPDESSSEEIDEAESDDCNYLQPIPTKKRRIMLRMSGVQRIDSEEKLSNRLLRESREDCGCDCAGVCSPSTCQCALAGIPCQVDRESFPCGCSVLGCSNPRGRVEFDATRVRNHYLRTLGRMVGRVAGVAATDPPMMSPYVRSTVEEGHQVVESSSCLDGSASLRSNDPECFASNYFQTSQPPEGGSGQCLKLEPIASFLSIPPTNPIPSSSNQDFILNVIGQSNQLTSHNLSSMNYCAIPNDDCAIPNEDCAITSAQ
uniref:Cysteine/serine-rich nuclear protein N-terminal domain-containing protein n=2 Tax=Ciona savignyi TaxID=51511 RepID=H2Y8B5_CIOSA